MKLNIKILSVALVFLFTLSAFVNKKASQVNSAKVIVLINHAKWCPVCKANGPRVNQEVVSLFTNDSNYLIVSNDLTDKSSKASSKIKCKEAGIENFSSKNKSTGTIYFIRSSDKSLISKISVKESSENIKAEFTKAVNQ